jgi:hypothetical protein
VAKTDRSNGGSEKSGEPEMTVGSICELTDVAQTSSFASCPHYPEPHVANKRSLERMVIIALSNGSKVGVHC